MDGPFTVPSPEVVAGAQNIRKYIGFGGPGRCYYLLLLTHPDSWLCAGRIGVLLRIGRTAFKNGLAVASRLVAVVVALNGVPGTGIGCAVRDW